MDPSASDVDPVGDFSPRSKAFSFMVPEPGATAYLATIDAFLSGMERGKKQPLEMEVRLGYTLGVLRAVQVLFRKLAAEQWEPATGLDHAERTQILNTRLTRVTDLLESLLRNSQHL